MRTRTDFKLNDTQLQHLSATCKGRQVGGVSMRALETRDLIWLEGDQWAPTLEGRMALRQARTEGW